MGAETLHLTVGAETLHLTMGGTLSMERKAGQDRISELPDDVLYHILSFLTIKEAVVTSLLSTRWRFLWTMVPSLDIDCSEPIIKFYKEVNVFLDLFRTQKITRFHLRCNSSQDCCSRYAEKWLNAIVYKKVEHVSISLNRCHANVFRFPDLFICTTLVTLKLQGLFPSSFPSTVHLPNLKIFHLGVNAFLCFPSVIKLLFGSPSLELFYLKQNWGERKMKIVRKHNSQVIQVFRHCCFYNLVMQDDCDYHFISNYVYNHRWPNILKAKVYLTVYYTTKFRYANQIVSTILQGLRNVEFLSLGDFREEMYLSNFDLPYFENLVELRLFLKNANSVFMELPAVCPKLKVLEVNIMDDRYGINQRCRYHITGGVRKHDLSIVPFLPQTFILGKCLSNPLK